MKRYFNITAILALLSMMPLTANAQQDTLMNQACYKDTALVDELSSKRDTVYLVRDFLRKGDWTLYYDFAFSQKMAEQHFTKYGHRTGTWRIWYKNGQLREEYDYTNSKNPGFPIGKTWYATGILKSERIQYTDSLVEMKYHPSGKPALKYLFDASGNCTLLQEWCESGLLVLNYNPTSLQPVPANKLHCNGKPQITGTHYRFGYVGAYTEYYENGKKAIDGQFTELPAGATAYMPTKTGTWNYYDVTGKLVKREEYIPGKPVKVTKF